MFKLLLRFTALLVLTEALPAQAQTALDGARQVVGLFASTCLQFADNPLSLRNFMKARRIPELTPEARAIFLRDHVGVGFDASNKVTRLALVSEDNGVCSAFADRADGAQARLLVEATAKARGFDLAQTGGQESSSSTFYAVKIRDHYYKLVFSSNPKPENAVQVAITLAP